MEVSEIQKHAEIEANKKIKEVPSTHKYYKPIVFILG